MIVRTVDPTDDPWVDEDQDQEPRTGSWAAQDLSAVLDGTYRPPQPTVGHRDDRIGLFYPGRVSSVASESEAGKTWLALLACLQELKAGRHVLYVDFEDDAGGVVGRLMALGANPWTVRNQFHYIRPEGPLTPVDLPDLVQLLQMLPSLAIVDGVTEGMSLLGLELKSNTDVARFSRQLLRPMADAGAAVVTLDHVVKSAENRGRYSLGGVHKLNGLNGVMYLLENVRPFGIGATGRSRIRIAKDRPAQLRRHALPHSSGLYWFGDLVIDSRTEQSAEAHLYPPVARTDEDQAATDEHRLQGLQAAIVTALQKAGQPLSKAGIEDRVTGKAADKRRALAALVDEGHVVVTAGPRGAQLHALPDPSATSSPPRPTSSRDEVVSPRPSSHSFRWDEDEVTHHRPDGAQQRDEDDHTRKDPPQ
ncbi:AAA family ATPase [Streptomyces sp. NPDC059787]|uniref:AAA family ATPase n=1 Tax=Streptomyces sp. NPDC059787 TaxID=3346947 RepID=UPI00365ED184